MILSVLICSLEKRAKMLAALTAELNRQRAQYGLIDDVEILSSVDGGAMSIGGKRNHLMRQATGKYVCYVDDDDSVSDDYLYLMVNACRLQPEVDCVGIVGDILWRGEHCSFVHSIIYSEWKYEGGQFFRPPNHLNPVKREIAMRFPFVEKNKGEDFDYSCAMQRAGALQSEAMVPATVYFYTPHEG